MATLYDIPTPALVLDATVLRRNIARMGARAADVNLPLRPHGKTPKCVEIARLSCATNARGLAVSTLLEAEQYFAAGVADLLYAVPFDPAKTARASRLVSQGAALTCIVDSVATARAIAAELHAIGGRLRIAIEIDVDGYRTGASLADVPDVARVIADAPCLTYAGLMAYAGASYSCRSVEAIRSLAERHRVALLETAQHLREIGIESEMLSFGSTPAILNATSLEGMTELRGGIYVFQDLFQAAIGACTLQDISLTVLCTVIANHRDRNRIVVDAGGLALSKDRSTASTDHDAGYGLVCDATTAVPLPDLYLANVSQEIGIITTRSGAPVATDLPVGTRLRVLPNHADMTAAAYDRYHVVEGNERVLDVWRRFNGW